MGESVVRSGRRPPERAPYTKRIRASCLLLTMLGRSAKSHRQTTEVVSLTCPRRPGPVPVSVPVRSRLCGHKEINSTLVIQQLRLLSCLLRPARSGMFVNPVTGFSCNGNERAKRGGSEDAELHVLLAEVPDISPSWRCLAEQLRWLICQIPWRFLTFPGIFWHMLAPRGNYLPAALDEVPCKSPPCEDSPSSFPVSSPGPQEPVHISTTCRIRAWPMAQDDLSSGCFPRLRSPKTRPHPAYSVHFWPMLSC